MNDRASDVLEERLLLLAPTGSDSADASMVLRRAGFPVTVCRNLDEMCDESRRGAAALLIAEESLLRDQLPAFVGCMNAQAKWSDLPIILMTGHGQLTADSNRLFEMFGEHGNISLLERPFRRNTLLSTLRMALRARHRQYQVRDLLEDIQHANAELEQRVADRTAQLNSSVKSLETFCHSLAHDLRAPLRAIRSFMNVFEGEYGPKLGEDGHALLSRVKNAAARMDSLINDLLTLSRMSQAEMPLFAVSVERSVAEAMTDLRDDITRTEAEIKTESLQEKVRANPVILRQVFENFLSNSLKYVKKGERPRVHIWSERKDRRIRVLIRDEGIGIAPQYHYKVFEVFQRLHNSEYPGTGVGLAIAKVGAERMAGSVGVESEVGGGSCFWVELNAA